MEGEEFAASEKIFADENGDQDQLPYKSIELQGDYSMLTIAIDDKGTAI